MEAVRKVYQYAEPNLTLVGWMGLLGFPVYYYIWAYLFPQPYENLALRLFCSALFALIAFRKALPKHIQRFMPLLYLFVIGFCLPFFFAFMMFQNAWSTVWVMSFMASIFLHILLVHQTRLMLAQALVCIALAFLFAYGFDYTKIAGHVVWAYVPIFLFTYIFGNLFYFRNQVEHETKASIAKSFGAGIAHEMRNPLAALKSSLEVLNSVLPQTSHGRKEFHLMSHQELMLARDVIADADEVIEHGNETIDLLLTSIDESRISRGTFKQYSALQVVEEAVASFSYRRAADKEKVTLDVMEDFQFLGSDLLLKYALYNLLKNAFYYQSGDSFRISITLRATQDGNELILTDTGVGIDPAIKEHIFKDFYTFGKEGSYGLGLPFCRKVMKALGGDISCSSQVGEWTKFTLSFPHYQSKQVEAIKIDLLKDKSVLYIGEQNAVGRLLNELSFYRGFRLNNISLETATKFEEYEFEYDLIMIDLDAAVSEPNYFDKLEQRLHFTEARLVYLYDENSQYYNAIERHLTVYPIEKHRFLLKGKEVLDELFFESPSVDRNVLPEKKGIGGKRIIVADDNQSLRTYTSILLERQGFEVVQAKNGIEVLEMLAAQPADLVLMDIEMPALNGIETTSRIRNSSEQYASIPILGHTGDKTEQSIEKIQSSGMNDYIVKPADSDLILDKIANWI
ncbi:hybrid sensor histidine kinase/response regulator [Vibrio sp. TRT 21S02]|uniref:hybrid sensor histidine kinase/response regulator n=1 Tax=Vibrio sp. TRT 21S02 TaxID=3418507 RepID=UPI003CF013D5